MNETTTRFGGSNKIGSKLGAREVIEIEHDIRAGETPAHLLAERYEVSTRTIVRMRSAMRKRGERIHDLGPEGWGEASSGSAIAGMRKMNRKGPWTWT